MARGRVRPWRGGAADQISVHALGGCHESCSSISSTARCSALRIGCSVCHLKLVLVCGGSQLMLTPLLQPRFSAHPLRSLPLAPPLAGYLAARFRSALAGPPFKRSASSLW